jgi:membrane fusion protein (multidrug efflux system)
MRRTLLSRAFLPAALVLVLGGCDSEPEQAALPAPQQAPPPAVTVVAVASQGVTPVSSFTGRVEAVDKVDLRARVEGFLDLRHFTEGQDVRQGDLLFTIEKAQYEAAVARAEADVARARATLDNAQLQLDRAEQLARNRNIAEATRDDRQAERDAARAELVAAEAALRTVRLDLGYTEITAPISGRIGVSAYSQGDLVNPASGTLATIVSQDPIFVTFPVSSRELLEVRAAAERRGEDVRAVRVKVRLPNGKLYDQAGAVNFVGNQVDPGTDTVTVRAALPNPARRLVDGQLVGVVVEREEPVQALVIPQAALLADQGGPYVLVVNSDSQVEQRRIKLGQQTGAEIVVEKGLAQGDSVIVDGLQQVRPGQVVQAAKAATEA